MAISLTSTAHLTRVYTLLIETYGEPRNEPDYDPLGGLVGTILSQHTSDINSGRAYHQLINAFLTWEEVRDAPTPLVAEAIRCGGLANIKAPRIQNALHTLTQWQEAESKTGPLTSYLYAALQKCTPEDGWKYLRQIAGVGPKTAACVMMFNMNQPVLAIDTGTSSCRTSKRAYQAA
jgi:endonuclease-3